MTAANPRVIATVAILLLLLGGGVVWLIRVASGAQDSTSTGSSWPSPSTAIGMPMETSVASVAPSTGPSADLSTPRARPSSTLRSPSRTRDTTPPVPERKISVGGVTLDNDKPLSMCATFRNARYEVPVEITAVRLDFVAPASSKHIEISSEHCAGNESVRTDFRAGAACRPGAVLHPGGDGCHVGIRATTDVAHEYNGTVWLDLRARCTSTSLSPCDAPELAPLSPSPTRPVNAYWTGPKTPVCVVVPAPDPPLAPVCES